MSEGGSTSIFNAHIKEIFDYLEQLCKQSVQNLELLKQIAGLVGDLIKLYGKKIQEVHNLEFVMPLLEILNRSENGDYKKMVAWCKKVIDSAKG